MRSISRKLVYCLIALVPIGCVDSAVRQTIDMAGAATLAVIEKSHITESAITATGEVRDPKYIIRMLYCQGVIGEVELKGLKIGADVSGYGAGEDKHLSVESLESIRNALTVEDWQHLLNTLVEKGIVINGVSRMDSNSSNGNNVSSE